MRTLRIVQAAITLLLTQTLLFSAPAAHAQAVTPQLGGGAKTTRINNLPYVLESQVTRILNGKSIAVDMTVPGDAAVIGPVCGAFYKGQKQPECSTQPAVFEKPAQGLCPEGTEFDLTRWSCWSCDKSKGFQRSVAAVDSDRACFRNATAQEKAAKTEFKPAKQVGTRCPANSFYDTIGGGSCWSCPDGYNVNLLVHVQDPNKCTKPGGEEFKYAQRYKKTILPSDCWGDAGGNGFHDIWDGGGCWRCPSGFGRTGYAVYDEKACSRAIAANDKPATQRPGGTCEQGTFTHTYKLADSGKQNENVACLKCPDGYDQVVLEAGDSPRKCQTTTTMVFAPAKKDSALTCDSGQEFDLIGLTQQDINTRAQFRGQSKKPKPVDSGTCWSCPDGYFRSVEHVKSDAACGSTGIDYYQGIMREPGLFGLDGAADVLKEIMDQDAKLPIGKIGVVQKALGKWVDEQAKLKAKSNEAYDKAAALTKEANLLATQPHKSGVAAGLVLARLLTALAEEDKATPAERRLLASFVLYVKMKRTFIAEIVRHQYNLWLDTVHWREKNATAKLVWDRASMSAYGRPPSFEQSALLATAGVGTAGLVAGTAVDKLSKGIPVIGEVAGLVISLAAGGYQDYLQGVEKAAYSGARTAGEIAFSLSLGAAVDVLVESAVTSAVTASALTAAAAGVGYSSVAVASSIAATSALASTGIGIGIGAVLIVASMELEQLNQFLDAPVKAGAILAKASETRKEDLVRMGKTGGGMTELLTYWSTAIDGDSLMTPAQNTAYAGLVQQHAYLKTASPRAVAAPAVPAGKWTLLPGAATDVAAGGNALWVVGTNPVPGGFGLHRWDGKTFVPVSGGAVRIDVDPQGNAWVVNDKDDIFRWTGSGWTQLPGKAKDIGVGANGAVWAIGTNPVPGGFGIYRWTGNAWAGVPGGAVRIDVDPKGNAWVVNSSNNIFRWNPAANTWDTLPGKARDIGIGPDGSVFVVGDNNTVHKWDESRKTWIMRDGLLNEISVGPNGVPVGVNASKQIWLGYQ